MWMDVGSKLGGYGSEGDGSGARALVCPCGWSRVEAGRWDGETVKQQEQRDSETTTAHSWLVQEQPWTARR